MKKIEDTVFLRKSNSTSTIFFSISSSNGDVAIHPCSTRSFMGFESKLYERKGKSCSSFFSKSRRQKNGVLICDFLMQNERERVEEKFLCLQIAVSMERTGKQNWFIREWTFYFTNLSIKIVHPVIFIFSFSCCVINLFIFEICTRSRDFATSTNSSQDKE